MRRRWIGFALLVLWAATLGSTPTASAEDEGPTPLQKAVAHLMTRLMKQDEGLCVGVPHKAAIAASMGASHMNGQYYASLRNTVYAPPGDWHGVISFFVDLEELRAKRTVRLDGLETVLTCAKYDKPKMRAFVLKTGRALGLALEADDEESDLYWDPSVDEGRELWISLGDDAIYIEVHLEGIGDEDGDGVGDGDGAKDE